MDTNHFAGLPGLLWLSAATSVGRDLADAGRQADASSNMIDDDKANMAIET